MVLPPDGYMVWLTRRPDHLRSANALAICSARADLQRAETAKLADALPGLQTGLQL